MNATNWYLTTNNPASSYGIPVLMVDGVAHGPGDEVSLLPSLFGNALTAAEHVRAMIELRGTRGAAYDADLDERLPASALEKFLRTGK